MIKAHRLELVLVIVAPVVAISVAYRLIAHTNWMTYDYFNVRLWPAVVHATPGTFVLHGLLLCTLSVVFSNTLAYAISAWSRRQPMVMISCILALLIVALWSAEIYAGFVTAWLEGQHSYASADVARHLHDGFASVLFFLFLLMDLVLYRRCGRIRTVNGDNTAAMTKERLEEDTYLLQLLMIDIPVVCGVITVNIVMHHLLEESFAIGEPSVREVFLTGFGAGSLVMQIALSQVVFFFIYVRQVAWTYHLHR